MCDETIDQNESNESQDDGGWISLVNDDILSRVVEREDELPATLSVLADMLSDSIPEAVAVADAVAQYGHAIVRFPEGKGFADLMDRKGDDFAGWKHFAVRAENGGVGGGNAAIRQVALSPTAVANMALQGAAIVVGHAYMARIDSELKGIRKDIDAVMQRLDDTYIGELEGWAETLTEYHDELKTISRDSVSRQAALNDIRHIIGSLRGRFNTEMKRIKRMIDEVSDLAGADEEIVRRTLGEFEIAVRRALFVFLLNGIAGQLELSYMNDYTHDNIRRVRKRVEGQANRLDAIHKDGIAALMDVAAHTKGPIWEEIATHFGNEIEDPKLIDVVLKVGRFALRKSLWWGSIVDEIAKAGGNAAHKSKSERQDRMMDETIDVSFDVWDDVMDIANRLRTEFDKLEFRHNEANALVLHGDKVTLAIVKDDDMLPAASATFAAREMDSIPSDVSWRESMD